MSKKSKLLAVLILSALMFAIFLIVFSGCEPLGDSYEEIYKKALKQAPPKSVVPGTPTSVTATVASTSSITVSWNSVTGANSYVVYRSTSSSGTFSQVGTSTSTSYTDTGLSASTTYYFKVSASNSNGEGERSSYAYATTLSSVPDAPTGVTATAASPSSITVSWNSVTGANSYVVYRSTSSSGTFSQVGTSTSTSYTDTGLSADTTYYYKVSASNNNGTGAQSSYASATILSSIEMVYVSGGNFQMGSTSGGYSDEQPVHTVTLTGFYMGKYEVTQAQYLAVMGSNPSNSYGVGNNYPVYYVSWYDALVFCNKLSVAQGLTPAYRINNSTDPASWGSVPTSSSSTWNAVEVVSGSTGYRLPTEAQWEYAAKGGNGSPGNYTYSGSDTVGDVAWYSSNSGSNTHAVGTKSPNGLGIYDMSGNVWEWCWDWYGSYSSDAQNNPGGAVSGTDRVRRGGSWGNSASDVRSAYRDYSYPNNRSSIVGCRLVRP